MARLLHNGQGLFFVCVVALPLGLLGCPGQQSTEERCNADIDCPSGEVCPNGFCVTGGGEPEREPEREPDVGPEARDAGNDDAGGSLNDAGQTLDAGVVLDGGGDAGVVVNPDGGGDAGVIILPDGGPVDSGPIDAGTPDPWWDTRWGARVLVGVTPSAPADVVDFPARLELTRSAFPQARADFGDVRFATAAGVELASELESVVDDVAIVWVRVSAFSATETTQFYAYSGNPNATARPKNPAVWANGYDGVWHLAGDLSNSVGANFQPTDLNTAEFVDDTVLGGGIDFPAGVEGGALIDRDTLIGTDATGATVSTYVLRRSNGTQKIFSLSIASPDDTEASRVSVGTNGTGRVRYSARINDVDDFVSRVSEEGVFPPDAFVELTVVFDFEAGAARAYIDGVEVDASDGVPGRTLLTPASVIRFGVEDTGFDDELDGTIAEVRFSRVARSPGWVALQAQLAGGDGVAFGETEVRTREGISDGPNTVDDGATVLEDADPIEIDLVGNDIGAASSSLFIHSISAPTLGKIVVGVDRTSVRYTPDADVFGTEVLTYTLSDGVDGTSEGTLTIDVESVNDLPEVHFDRTSVRPGETISVSVLTNDYDLEGGLDVDGLPDVANLTLSAQGGVIQVSASPLALSQTVRVNYDVIDGDGGRVPSFLDVGIYRSDLGFNLNRRADTGLGSGASAYGLAVADINNDGLRDVVETSTGVHSIYRGVAPFAFQLDQAVTASDARTVTFGDIDNDGTMEMVATTNLRLYARSTDGYVLRPNVFDVSDNVGTVTWVNADLDAFGDLFVASGYDPFPQVQTNIEGSVGSRAFEISTPLPITRIIDDNVETSTAADIDRDGDTDILVLGDRPYLFINESGIFSEQGIARGLDADPGSPFHGMAFGDCDNDGDFDLFVGTSEGIPMRLYRNDQGTFTLDNLFDFPTANTLGITTGDIDNDGNLDVFAGVDRAESFTDDPSLLLMNRGDCNFVDVGSSEFANVAAIQEASGGAVMVDLDKDGDLDLIHNVDNDLLVYENTLNPDPTVEGRNRSLRVVVRGESLRATPRDGSGMVIELVTQINDDDVERQTRQIDGGHGFGSQVAGEVHFGVGQPSAQAVFELRIFRPDGTVEILPVDPDTLSDDGPFSIIVTH